MSDSELSDAASNPVPPDAELERTLRRAVVKASKNNEEVTVNSIRIAAEQELGLGSGFFANHDVWKARSKDIIRNQFERQTTDKTANEEGPPKAKPNSKAPKAAKSDPPQKVPAKRSSPATNSRPRKKSKPSTAAEDDDDSDALSSPPLSDEEKPPTSKKSQTPSKSESSVQKKPAIKKSPPTPRDDSESELSSPIDDEPAPKKRAKSKDNGSDKPKKSKPTKQSSVAEADPDQEEIKRLQGWLAKCGIRKVWGKELKPFDTPKAKVKYLRQMLTDAGMTGRYSNERASQIKEARELAADIEAVQEGNERWGKSDGEGDEADDKPRTRRLIRGAKHYDFLSSDGEETD